jgi:hypothetical protein
MEVQMRVLQQAEIDFVSGGLTENDGDSALVVAGEIGLLGAAAGGLGFGVGVTVATGIILLGSTSSAY